MERGRKFKGLLSLAMRQIHRCIFGPGCNWGCDINLTNNKHVFKRPHYDDATYANDICWRYLLIRFKFQLLQLVKQVERSRCFSLKKQTLGTRLINKPICKRCNASFFPREIWRGIICYLCHCSHFSCSYRKYTQAIAMATPLTKTTDGLINMKKFLSGHPGCTKSSITISHAHFRKWFADVFTK